MAGTSGKDAYEMLRRIRMDLSDLQAKVTSLFAILNELNLQDVARPACPYCAISLRNGQALDEHIYVQHNGPVPPHWAEAETRAADVTPLERATMAYRTWPR